MNEPTEPRSSLQAIVDSMPADLKQLLEALATGGAPRSTPTESSEEPGLEYDGILANAWRRAKEQTTDFAKESMDATHVKIDILELSPSQRRTYVLNQRRLQTTAMAAKLLRLSWDQRSIDPEDAEAIASLALEVLERVESTPQMPGLLEDLRSRAWGQIGNARRIQSNLQGADEALKQARKHLAQGSRDPLERALIDHWTGALRRDQRRFDEAIVLLKRACRECRLIRDQENHIQALIALGYTYREAGDSNKGLQVMRRTESLLPPDHPMLLYARHNQIYFLVDLARYDEATELLAETRPLYAHAPEPLVRLRLPWVEGRIAKHTDRLAEAEYLFQQVRQGFIQHGIAYDAALVSLELAEIYVQQGRNEELKELAREMVTVFRSRNVERETIAALLMLHHVASAERASLHVIRDIAQRLRVGSPQSLAPLESQDL